MYCPQCGQQQISETTRFCSRCGLLVSGLAEWLARGGMVPSGADERAVFKKPVTAKRKGMTRGAKLMFLSGVLLPLFVVFSIAVDEPGPLIIPFTTFVVGLTILLYARLFGDDTPLPDKQAAEPRVLSTLFRKSALPPASQSDLHNATHRPVRTSELVGPPSVTEHTTKLLDRD